MSWVPTVSPGGGGVKPGIAGIDTSVFVQEFFAAGVPWFVTLFGRDVKVTTQQHWLRWVVMACEEIAQSLHPRELERKLL